MRWFGTPIAIHRLDRIRLELIDFWGAEVRLKDLGGQPLVFGDRLFREPILIVTGDQRFVMLDEGVEQVADDQGRSGGSDGLLFFDAFSRGIGATVAEAPFLNFAKGPAERRTTAARSVQLARGTNGWP